MWSWSKCWKFKLFSTPQRGIFPLIWCGSFPRSFGEKGHGFQNWKPPCLSTWIFAYCWFIRLHEYVDLILTKYTYHFLRVGNLPTNRKHQHRTNKMGLYQLQIQGYNSTYRHRGYDPSYPLCTHVQAHLVITPFGCFPKIMVPPNHPF